MEDEGAGIEGLFRDGILELQPYKPILPLELLSQQAGVDMASLIKLDGNENPYGCSPKVRQALARYPYYHIYPDPTQHQLRQALESYVGLSGDYVVAGAGSDELIDLVLRLFLNPGDRVINCVPTFGMYPFSTGVCGGKVSDVPRRPDYTLDIDAVRGAIDDRTKVIFIASPNNPSGNSATEAEIVKLVATGRVVVVDEAYYEFGGHSVAHLVPHYENLVVLRTFSKWAGLAGLRVGYGIFPKKIVEQLFKIKPPYNISSAALVAALASLADLDYLKSRVQAIIEERGRLFARLGQLSFLKPLPSDANFILCRVTRGNARAIYEALQRRGIFIRYFDTPLLRNCIRISVGKPEHTDAVIQALKEIGEASQ